MFIRVVKSKQRGKIYNSVQLCQAYRDKSKGGVPRTKILAHLGQVDAFTDRDVDSILNGLCKAFGRQSARDVCVVEGKDFGHIYALLHIWKHLKIGTILKQKAHARGYKFDMEAHIRLMVFNRLSDPCSKLALLEWIEGVYLPGIDPEKVEYHHLLRAMDWLIEQKEAVEKAIADEMLTLFDTEVDLVFYDVTSSYFEGDRSVSAEDIRRYGYSRDGRPDRRQIVIGLVMTREGIPLAHHVFEGNRADKKTLGEVVKDLKERFGIRRAVFVADRGMLSDENLEAILDVDFDYILSLPMRHSVAVQKLLKQTEGKWNDDPKVAEQYYLDESEEAVRYAVAYDPEMAERTRKKRTERLEKADRFIKSELTRLERANREPRPRGRPPTVQGTFEKIHDYLRDRKLDRYYKVEMNEQGLEVTPENKTRKLEEKIDGKLVVESSCADLNAQELIGRYKELADIERAFRTLKSTLEIRPMYHWTEQRIRAHVFICVLALQMQRYMRSRLSASPLSVERALQRLQTLKAGTLETPTGKTHYLAALQDKHKEVFEQLQLPFPKLKHLEAAGL
jgi:transposase